MGTKYMNMMQEAGAIGDICGRYFGVDGQLIEAEFYERMISISLEQIKKVSIVIAVASGVEKTRAVLAAMKSRLFSVLFIEELLADSILQELDRK